MPNHYQNANVFGPRQTIHQVSQFIQTINQLQKNIGGSQRLQLLRTGARIAEFLGWLHQDLGDHRRAVYWSDRAMQWSQEINDPSMQSYMLFRKANMAVARRSPYEAIGLAQAGSQVHGASPLLRALAVQMEAQGHALTQADRIANLKFDEAVDLTTQASGEDPDWAGYCTPTYIEMQRADSWSEMGNPRRAIDLFEAELTKLPRSFMTDRGVYLARLAHAYAKAGEPTLSTQAATRSLQIATMTSSGRALEGLTLTSRELTQWQNLPEVADFRTRLDTATPSLTFHPGAEEQTW